MGAGFIYGRNLQGNAKRLTAAVEEGDKVCEGNRILFECTRKNDTSYGVRFIRCRILTIAGYQLRMRSTNL